MLIVAFDFRGTPEMALDQHRAGVSAQRHGRRVKHRTAGNHFFRLAHVRNDGLERQLDAASHARQRHATRP